VFEQAVMRKGLLVCALVLLSPGSASATPGDLDPTFSRDGFVKVGLESAFQSGQIAVESDGRILVATTARGGGSGSGSFLLSRVRHSGKPDRSFSGDGTVVPALGSASARIADLAIDPQGRALVAADGGGDFVVARFLATGEPDPGFAGDGVAELDLGASETVEALAVQPDGAILVGGRSAAGGTAQLALARLTTGGAPDAGFSTDGMLRTDLAPLLFAGVSAVAVADDGFIYAGGSARQPTGFDPNDGIVARYESDGDLDASFADSGIARVDGGFAEVVQGIGFDPGGRTLVTGDVTSGSTAFAGRLTGAGFFDTSIGDDGFVFGEGAAAVGGFAVDAEGRIVIAGATPFGRFGGPRDIVLNRFGAGATGLDEAFAGDGVVIGDFRQHSDGASDLALDPDGRIVIAGNADDDLLLARFEVAQGKPDIDGDGVRDNRDLCPPRYSPRPRGCPVYPRRVSITRDASADLFRGDVRSPQPKCVSRVTVRIRRVRPGPDKKLAKVSAGPSGGWSVDASLKPGAYYAVAPRVVQQRLGICKAARSGELRIP
jgi:uncharacterized delta-60 repeat protein